MARKVDPAILAALGLDPQASEISPHGGSGFAATFKLTTKIDGKEIKYFVKTGSGPDAEIMFRGEHTSLNAIHAAVPSFCPQSHAHGALQATPGSFFLATAFLELGGAAPAGTPAGSGQSLAAKLATLHTTPAPAPDGASGPRFGFPVPTCCGATVQDNGWRDSWADFYAECRLRHILRACEARHGRDGRLAEAVERTAGVVVPRLLWWENLKGVRPVVVHGDLWSGNHGRGRVGGEGGVEEVVFDPSCVYGHSEYELGIMRMFGGFGKGFWDEYGRLVPKHEPAGEWEDRVTLYELYHHLNHYAIFGGGYLDGAMGIMKKLIAKYG